ncbi:hypothetical protein YN1_4440 [Nanoarchaeota archaeon]
MKNDIALDTIFIIIIAVISVFVILDIIYTKFFANSQLYYCKTLISEGGFSPECAKYYPSAINVIFTNQSKDEIYSEFAGLVANCYNNNINTNRLFSICYDVYIDEDVVLNISTIYSFIVNYTNFNPYDLIFNLPVSHYETLIPYESIFIIYNNSQIVVWQ